jgi:hypothetical protein
MDFKTMYTQDIAALRCEVTNAAIAELLVNFILPNTANLNTEGGIKRFNKVKERQDKIIELLLKYKQSLVPVLEKIHIIYSDKESQINGYYLSLMSRVGTQIVTSKEEMEQGKKRLKGIEKKLTTRSIVNFITGGTYGELPKMQFVTTKYDPKEHEDIFTVYAHEVAQLWTLHFCSIVKEWNINDVVNLAVLLNPNLVELKQDKDEKNNIEEEYGVIVKRDNQDYYFSFSGLWVSGRSLDRKANPVSTLWNKKRIMG